MEYQERKQSTTPRLSHAHLHYYLNFLLMYNLIEYDRSRKLYMITSKGKKVIELYDKMISLLEGSPCFDSQSR
jgi:predicted transcriptional regulator